MPNGGVHSGGYDYPPEPLDKQVASLLQRVKELGVQNEALRKRITDLERDKEALKRAIALVKGN